MSKLFGLRIILIAAMLFCFLANTEIFAQRRHPAENSKAARSWSMDFETSIEFRNGSGKPIKVYWLNATAERHYLFDLPDGESKGFKTFVSYMYLVTDEQNNALGMYSTDGQSRIIQIGGAVEAAVRPPDNRSYPDKNYNDKDRRNDDDDEYDERNSPGKTYDTTPITICSNQEIPRGFVIISAGSGFNCPGWNAIGKNTYTIQRPSRTDATTVCSIQPIPRGFVITAASSNFNCPNWSAIDKNAYAIRRPRDMEDICSVSEVPRNFVVVADRNNWNCPNWSATGTNSKSIKRIR